MQSKAAVAILLISISEIFCSSSLDGRIVGGQPANISNFPFQVSFQYNGAHTCGATILNKRIVLTAAHCCFSQSIKFLSIYAGSTYHYKDGIRIKVEEKIIHPNYNYDTSDFDIAILKLASDLPISDKIRPVILPQQDEQVYAGSTATVSGWGYLQEYAPRASRNLEAVTVKVVSLPLCKRLYGNFGGVTPRMLCAGSLMGGRDACQGDSGGPLTINGKIIGIVSWGYGCARPGYPGVYTRVAVLINWINLFLTTS